MSDEPVETKRRKNKPKYAPHMTKEYVRNRQLAEFYQQTTVPKSMCFLCSCCLPEGSHVHVNNMYMIPMTRDGGPNRDSFAMGKELFKGDRVVVLADTSRSKEEHSHLLLNTRDTVITIQLARQQINCIEFVKLNAFPDDFWNNTKPDPWWEMGYSLNGEPPGVIKMSYDRRHRRFLNTPSTSVLTLAFWKKNPPIPEIDFYKVNNSRL